MPNAIVRTQSDPLFTRSLSNDTSTNVSTTTKPKRARVVFFSDNTTTLTVSVGYINPLTQTVVYVLLETLTCIGGSVANSESFELDSQLLKFEGSEGIVQLYEVA